MTAPRRFLAPRLPRVRRGQAGFTLIELMVAMTGGLFLAVVVVALSRDASRVYQQETRVANATLSGVNGFERLVNDIARAGHLTTPNISADPRVCNRPSSGGSWPTNVQNLRAIKIEVDSAQVAGTEVAAAGIAPMGIEIAGALDVTEELITTHVGPNEAGGYSVFVRRDTPSAARLGIKDDNAANATNLAILQAIFIPDGVNGRAVRITQLDGMEQYGVVTTVISEPQLEIRLKAEPELVFRTSSAGSLQCGFQGFNTGGTINAVNFIRYRLEPMTGDPAYAALFSASSGGGGANVPYEAGRVELVRQELAPDGATVLSSEIVAEYAVDLQFSLLQATNPTTPALIDAPPATVDLDFDSTQLLRGIRARLSVRSREADRLADVTGVGGGANDRYRIALGSGGTTGAPAYARLRTFQSDVPLRNLEGANWP